MESSYLGDGKEPWEKLSERVPGPDIGPCIAGQCLPGSIFTGGVFLAAFSSVDGYGWPP
jgi:hypothetical protein